MVINQEDKIACRAV